MSNPLSVHHRLAIDAGNTRIKLGLFACSNASLRGELPSCVERAVVLSHEPIPWELLVRWHSTAGGWQPAVIAGSNPRDVERVQAAWPSSLGSVPQIEIGRAHV